MNTESDTPNAETLLATTAKNWWWITENSMRNLETCKTIFVCCLYLFTMAWMSLLENWRERRHGRQWLQRWYKQAGIGAAPKSQEFCKSPHVQSTVSLYQRYQAALCLPLLSVLLQHWHIYIKWCVKSCIVSIISWYMLCNAIFSYAFSLLFVLLFVQEQAPLSWAIWGPFGRARHLWPIHGW